MSRAEVPTWFSAVARSGNEKTVHQENSVKL